MQCQLVPANQLHWYQDTGQGTVQQWPLLQRHDGCFDVETGWGEEIQQKQHIDKVVWTWVQNCVLQSNVLLNALSGARDSYHDADLCAYIPWRRTLNISFFERTWLWNHLHNIWWKGNNHPVKQIILYLSLPTNIARPLWSNNHCHPLPSNQTIIPHNPT